MASAVAPTTVEFQDTSRLQFGGVWISSDFYSHSGGYRLCLVLKSTKIDRPTSERHITKPTQQIAVIAINDGTDRQWPCEGMVTMRFEIPRNNHLRGHPNPPFVVNFSIGEPSTNIQLRVKFEGNLPPGLVRSWTSIPQECVPFYLEYSPPSIFERNKPLSQQHAEILTNNASNNIIVKIEDVKIALKGVKRALDSSPPEKRKKLALDSQFNEPIFLSGGNCPPPKLRDNHKYDQPPSPLSSTPPTPQLPPLAEVTPSTNVSDIPTLSQLQSTLSAAMALMNNTTTSSTANKPQPSSEATPTPTKSAESKPTPSPITIGALLANLVSEKQLLQPSSEATPTVSKSAPTQSESSPSPITIGAPLANLPSILASSTSSTVTPSTSAPTTTTTKATPIPSSFLTPTHSISTPQLTAPLSTTSTNITIPPNIVTCSQGMPTVGSAMASIGQVDVYNMLKNSPVLLSIPALRNLSGPLTANDLLQKLMEIARKASPTETATILKSLQQVEPPSGMEIAKHYAAYQQALKDGSHLTLSYLKFLFFGPPRSGKTSMRRRLIREILNLSQLNEPSVSTGVAETNDVIIKKFTNESVAVANSQWCSIKRDTTRPNTHSKEDLHSLTQLFYKLICKHATSSGNEPAQVQPQGDNSLLMTAASSSMDTAHFAPVASVLINPEGVEIDNAFLELTTILQLDSPEELEHLLKELSVMLINMTDVGGQPAFLDMLPALTTGPALYLLFFRLDQELKTYYPVRYLPADGNGEMTLESSYSIEEVLFRSLASIACFSCPSLAAMPASIPQSAESASQPNAYRSAESASKLQASSRALLFGTYKDKVNNDQITQMEHTLQEKFMKTKLYGEGLLLKSGSGKMLLTVDNMFGTDESEMSDIREDIERIIKANFPPVPIPASWLMFMIVLRLLNKPVVSLAQCEEIAERLSMPTSVEEAIWFFHHNIGSLMHYPDIPSMKTMIICDPQVIFDCISTLIIDKFKYENRELESCVVDEFSQKGQFSLSHIKDKTGHSNCPLTLDQLMDLLKHHNVVAEITHDQHSEQKFIMPAVLKFASEEELNTPIAGSSEHQAIMIHFDGGFVPFGVFSTCTAHLIAHQDSMTPKWQLCEEQVRRNKVTFRIDGAFYAVIIARPQYLEITVSRHPRARCKRSLLEICSNVRQEVTETLKTVISKMKYKPFGSLLSCSTEQPFDLAFRCCLDDSHSDHLMKVVEDKSGRYAKCLKDGINTRLEEKHHNWFSQDVSESQSKASTSRKADSGCSAVPDTLTSPQASHDQPPVYLSIRVKPALLQLIKWTEGSETKRFFLTDKIANKWRCLGRLLSIEGGQLEGFARQYQNDINECCQAVLTKWQENPPPKYPATWGGLIELLEDCQLPEVVKELKEILNKVDLS